MEEMYKKVIIESENDLPKEKGFYITGTGNMTEFNPDKRHIQPFQTDSIEYWMACINEYLQPLPQLREVTDLRAELIKFCNSIPMSMDDNCPFDTDEEMIDEYLHEREKGTMKKEQ
jgi:hypothetical protein